MNLPGKYQQLNNPIHLMPFFKTIISIINLQMLLLNHPLKKYNLTKHYGIQAKIFGMKTDEDLSQLLWPWKREGNPNY